MQPVKHGFLGNWGKSCNPHYMNPDNSLVFLVRIFKLQETRKIMENLKKITKTHQNWIKSEKGENSTGTTVSPKIPNLFVLISRNIVDATRNT